MSRYIRYIENLLEKGVFYFTIAQLQTDLGISWAAAISSVYHLKRKGYIISPVKGLYVIIPIESRPYGALPAADLVPIIMDHLQLDYYVACLSAGLYHGATHQKPGSFQVITNKQWRKNLVFGRVKIKFIFKKDLANLPTKNFLVNTGYLKVATPELTALDLFLYPDKCGGLNHIATVLSELVEAIDENKLMELAKKIGQNAWLQRMGYILEQIEPDDEKRTAKVLGKIYNYLHSKDNKLKFVPLASELPEAGHPYNQKWKIIENTYVESDIT
jgi:predicted transcriptional regulator of viral defense system